MVAGDQLLDPRREIRLERGIVLEAIGAHECLDPRVRIPFLSIALIAADMKVLIGKERRHLAQQLVDELIGALLGRIHRGIQYAKAGCRLIGAAPLPKF